MFKCDNCRKTTKPKERIHSVYEKREKVYEHKKDVYDKKTRKVKTVVKKTNGWEIVKQHNFCKVCFEKV